MPFAVFRRHQKSMIAVLGILAMFAFVVAPSLPKLLNGSSGDGGNPEVVKLYGRSVRRMDLNRMAFERSNANQFLAELWKQLRYGQAPPSFGAMTTDALVDALILEHEADRLKMPSSPALGRDWLKMQPFSAVLSPELFELILKSYNNRISGEQLLLAISNQVRLSNVRQLLGSPVITPLDVFSTFRDQNEKVSTRDVGFRTEDYLKDVAEPKPAEVEAYFDKYKDALPDADSPTPGFKIPRRVKLEILSIDGEALSRSIKDKLTDAELLSYYEAHKSEFAIPSPFPADIFQGGEPLPPQLKPFSEVKVYLGPTIADERMKSEISKKFETINDQMADFAGTYADVLDDNLEAKKDGNPEKPVPSTHSFETVAKEAGLEHKLTLLLTREQAEKFGILATSAVGMERFSDGRKFIDEVFDAKPRLFEPVILSDPSGFRFLIRKLEDQEPRVPTFQEAEADVVLAWKTERARPLAEKAAEAYAETVRKAGGKIVGEIVEGHAVITTDLVAKLQPSMIPGQMFANGPAIPSEIIQIPHAGTAFRDAYFALKEGQVAVAPNAPKTTYYVLTLRDRTPATFELLYAMSGEYERYQGETFYAAIQKQSTEWMNELRAAAGLPPGWTYKDDSKSG